MRRSARRSPTADPRRCGPPEPTAARRRWAAGALGCRSEALRWRWLGAREGPTRLWEIAAAGRRYICKEHGRGRGFAQERRAYAAWRPALAAWLPELIAVDRADGGALLLEGIAGAPPAGDGEVADHRRAGRFLAALAELRLGERGRDDDATPPGEALRMRVDAALRRALTAGVAVADGLELPARARELAGEGALGRRRWCHRDFGPWNWLRVGDRLRVVDLEHARPDLSAVDLVRLECGPWRRRPALREALFDGLGRRLDAREAALLALLADLHAVTTITWARGHRAAALAGDAAEYLRSRSRGA